MTMNALRFHWSRINWGEIAITVLALTLVIFLLLRKKKEIQIKTLSTFWNAAELRPAVQRQNKVGRFRWAGLGLADQ